MPRPSAWTKNILSGTKKIYLGPKKFVRDKTFLSGTKNFEHDLNWILMNRNELLTGDQNILSRTKYFCPGQNFFCPRQNFFVPDKTFFVHAEGQGINLTFYYIDLGHPNSNTKESLQNGKAEFSSMTEKLRLVIKKRKLSFVKKLKKREFLCLLTHWSKQCDDFFTTTHGPSYD